MLRFKLRYRILASSVPLIAAVVFAGAETLEIGSAPWHADLHVSFTDDPKLATVRVATTDSAADADFAVVDDVDANEESACGVTPATQFIALSAEPTDQGPVIYLGPDDGHADYRVFVKSSRFTVREAAALIVGARGERPQLATTL